MNHFKVFLISETIGSLLKQHSEFLKCGKVGNSKNRPCFSKWGTRNFHT